MPAAVRKTTLASAAWLAMQLVASAEAPPSLPPLPFEPFGFQQQLLPGAGNPSFQQPRPIGSMNSLFSLPAEPFGELGHNLSGSPTQSVPHRQPIPTGSTLGGAGKKVAGAAAGGRGPISVPDPGYTKVPFHRRPLGW
ncbi:MAG: hypothetical protein K8U03_12035 [Planctomycetia bacterium]|nr:hypothetical protein [Planctomycetia bacterium]